MTAVMRCSKPGCGRPAAVLLGYDYAARRALLEDAADGDVSPHVYALCNSCADKLRAPRGWMLDDCRRTPPLFAATGTGERNSEEPSSLVS